MSTPRPRPSSTVRPYSIRRDEGRYFVGLAAEQDGRRADAEQAWRAMLDGAPADAPGRPLVTAALARVGSVAPALSEEALAAADGMSDAARDTMVRGMIDRLAARLEQNRDDVDGWLRLVRAYMVLGDRTKAQAISPLRGRRSARIRAACRS